MGFVAFAENLLIEKLKSLSENREFSFGLVIAQTGNNLTHVTHLAPLPPTLVDDVSDDDNATNVPPPKPTNVASLTEPAVSTHACQVVRMLPGGLDVVGVYVITPLLELNSSATQGKLRILLTGIHKATSKYFLGTKESSLQKLVLFGCTESTKIGLKTFDLSEQGTSLVTGTLKPQEVEWIQLNYDYSLSYPIYFPKEKTSQSVMRNVLISFRPWAQSLQDTTLLIDGKIFSEDEQIICDEMSPPPSSKRKGSSKKESTVKCFSVEILENQNPSREDTASELLDCSGSILFSGTVAGRAFLNSKATAAEAFEAVRKDLIRSLVSRWEMHCDSLIEEPQGSSSDPVLHEPPRRVFLKGCKSAISWCDYLFPGDSVLDACQSARELLDLPFQEGDVDDSAEKWADPEEFIAPETLATFVEEKCFEEISAVKQSNAFQAISVFVGILAIAVFYYLITSKA